MRVTKDNRIALMTGKALTNELARGMQWCSLTVVRRPLGDMLSPEDKEVTLSPEAQAKRLEREIKDFYADKPLQGTTWNLYTIARRCCYGTATEDLRAEHPQIFFESYYDLLQTAFAEILDTDKLAAYIKKYTKKMDSGEKAHLSTDQLNLRAHFAVGQNAIVQYMRRNRSKMYRVAVNDEGLAPNKEEKAELSERRKASYTKYVPTIDYSFTDTDGTEVDVYAYHEPQDAYNTTRVATVNQDESWKGNTSWNAGETAFISDISSLEFAETMLRMELKQVLSPKDLKVAMELLDGQISTVEFNKVAYRRRTVIQDTFKSLLA